MARGVGPALLSYVLEEGATAGKPVQAEFIRTSRNRPMYLMFKMAGFRQVGVRDEVSVLEHDLSVIPPMPGYLRVERSYRDSGAVTDS